jgi:hypothetical protein
MRSKSKPGARRVEKGPLEPEPAGMPEVKPAVEPVASAEPEHAAEPAGEGMLPEPELRPRRVTLALVVVPIVLLILAGLLVDARGRYSLGRNLDPEYCYLLNSLSILTFHAPGHIDHPGTSVQLLGAVVIFFKWFPAAMLGNWIPMQEAVLRDPESFLHAINLVLNLLIAASVFCAGRRMYRVSGSLLAAIVLQASIFLFRESVLTLARVSPEPLLIAVAYSMACVVVSGLVTEKGPSAISLGALFGFGVVTKVTFLPWVSLVALLRRWRERAWFVVAAVAACVLFTLPIFSKLPAVFHWLISLMTHTGYYGQGPSGFMAPAMVTDSANRLFTAEPFMFYWLAYYIAAVAAIMLASRKSRSRLTSATIRLLWVGCVCMAIQIAMAVKSLVAARYVLPALLIMPLLNCFLAWLLASGEALNRATRFGIALVGSGLLLASIGSTASRVKQWAVDSREYQAGINKLSAYRLGLGDCMVIGYYTSSVGEYALTFGGEYTEGVHGKVLESIYPDRMFLHGNRLFSFTLADREERLRQMLSEGRCVLIQGTPIIRGPGGLPDEFSVTEVTRGADEVLYRMSLASPAPSAPGVHGNGK